MAIYILIVSLEKGTKDTAVFLNRASFLANDQKVHVGLQSQNPLLKCVETERVRDFTERRDFRIQKEKWLKIQGLGFLSMHFRGISAIQYVLAQSSMS